MNGGISAEVRVVGAGKGAFLSMFLAVGSNYTDIVLRGTYMTSISARRGGLRFLVGGPYEV